MLMLQTEARIYLSDQRLCWQSSHARRMFTLAGGRQSGRSPFGPLRVLSDDLLQNQKVLLQQAESDFTLIVIPYIGDLIFSNAQGVRHRLDEGQLGVWNVNKGQTYEIENPYDEEAINLFQIGLSRGIVGGGKASVIVLDDHPNELRTIYEAENSLLIGKFAARQEGKHTLLSTSYGIFAFVIEGAFEVQGRLLHARDGLALWNLAEVEFEAMSPEAVLLVIEVKA
jgi:quercetin 2,3-dioxygenase